MMKRPTLTIATCAAFSIYIFLLIAFSLSSFSEHMRVTQRVAASASNNNLTVLLQQTDSTGSPILNRSIGPVQYAGSVGVFTNAILADTNSHSQTLPTTTVLQFYFKNTATAGNVTLTWTPSGGSSNIVKKVGPGGVVAFWEPATGDGITTLTIQSDTNPVTYEMFLGG